ncbi:MULTISPECIES: nickel/cobalt efflux transporter [unclassified Sulfurospirillum]|uniref:nickel/cobalt efflux transporter n=1 Tax=unclassified Sulfurospirillum TaxID=2618290 RepID=UPI0004FFFC10|nr:MULTISPECIES: nickel/cobalt efflux transporter [unclassified Sulfurospirillum]KFL34182.1 nickel transporter [Sulfurospirillum sp. SCADC]
MDMTTLITDGSNLWVLLASAIILGALHGLEPGHSKTMMASFIIAIKGSIWQAVMLGVAATISHTAIVWIIALMGLYFGAQYSDGVLEPYLQVASAIIIIGIALWMIRQTYKTHQQSYEHDHKEDAHDHHCEDFVIETEIGIINLSIFEKGQPPKFRLIAKDFDITKQDIFTVQTERANGEAQSFSFIDKGDFLESVDDIPEPHEFMARVLLTHNEEAYAYDIEFVEHAHGHVHNELVGLDLTSPGYQDAHELAHANDIRKRFANKDVTNWQVLLFGLTGGLIPCPASITVLLLCLQLKKMALGATLVLGFSIGLAITLVLTGSIAAISANYMSKKFTGFGTIARKAPYFSGGLILCIGLYIGYEGLIHLV